MNEFILEHMSEWSGMLQIIFIAFLLYFAKIFKEKVPGVNKVIIPTALVAGFFGWLLGDQALGLFTVDVKFLEVVIYNAMAIGFIALALKTTEHTEGVKPFTTGAIIASGYLFQAILGIIIILVLFNEVFIGAGVLLALGFSQGPSLAFNIGHGWEESGLLFLGSGLGIAIAAIGFLWGGIAGVIINNYHARKHNLKILNREDKIVYTSIEIESHSKISLFDSLTTNLVLVLMIYGIVFVLLLGTSYYLPKLGDLGNTFAGLFYGLNFLAGIWLALGFKKIQKRMIEKGRDIKFMTNNYILQSISSFMFNVLITASVLIITSASVKEYLLYILIGTSIAGVLTYYYFKILAKWQYSKNQHLYTMGLYGGGTGTISTGIALVKMLDPELDQPVVQDIVMGSGTALFFAIPLFAILGLIEAVHDQGVMGLIYIGIAMFGYMGILLFGLAIGKRVNRRNDS